jgi:PEP-CTERM motif-containing protein
MGDSDMKAAFLLIVLALALPLTAFADGIVLTNQNGSIAISNAGITSIGSQLRSFNGIVAPPGHSLGSVSFSTGALISGSIATGGTFSSTGSSFVVIGKGNYGQPKGTIFSGSFVGPIIWTLTSPPGAKNLTFTLSGTIQGMLFDGRMVSGTTVQNIYTIKGQLAQGIGHIKVGSTPLSVPEPGTLSMFGVGLVALGGMVRRKLIG